MYGGPGWVAQLVRVAPMCQGCRFDPRSGHIQDSTKECINKWNNKSTPLCLSSQLKIFFKSIQGEISLSPLPSAPRSRPGRSRRSLSPGDFPCERVSKHAYAHILRPLSSHEPCNFTCSLRLGGRSVSNPRTARSFHSCTVCHPGDVLCLVL